jgi:hypothetical protein
MKVSSRIAGDFFDRLTLLLLTSSKILAFRVPWIEASLGQQQFG